MWLEAILTREDLQEVVQEFSPLKIVLGDSGSLLLVAPCEVAMIADVGISVRCDATIHWPVLGFDVPVALHGLTVRIMPTVEQRPAGATLVFRLQIDHTGVAMLPHFFDDHVTARVNEELEKKHVELAWNFIDTLSHVFALPASLASSSAFSLRATAGQVKATETALGLAVDFEASVKPRLEGVAPDAAGDAVAVDTPATGEASSDSGARTPHAVDADHPANVPTVRPPGVSRPIPPNRMGGLDSRSLAVGAAATWLVLTGARFLGGLARRRGRWGA